MSFREFEVSPFTLHLAFDSVLNTSIMIITFRISQCSNYR
jgi:hypothetical protein